MSLELGDVLFGKTLSAPATLPIKRATTFD
jgi:hypothetical protein